MELLIQQIHQPFRFDCNLILSRCFFFSVESYIIISRVRKLGIVHSEVICNLRHHPHGYKLILSDEHLMHMIFTAVSSREFNHVSMGDSIG